MFKACETRSIREQKLSPFLGGFFSQIPVRKSSTAAQNFGGPAAQIHGLCDAMPTVCSEHDGVRTPRMLHKYRAPLIGDQDRPTPAVREADIFHRRVEGTDTRFESRDELRRFP